MARTQQILLAMGEPEAFALLDRLRYGPEKQTKLARAAGVAESAASSRIERLESLGLVRRSSARAALEIVERDAFEAVFEAADRLTGLLLAAEVAENDRRLERYEGVDKES